MNYNVFGGFELRRKDNRHGVFGKYFWDEVNGQKLSEACGCYVFALQNGKNIRPWYVGKAERQTFKRECFSPAKQLIFNEILVDHNGIP